MTEEAQELIDKVISAANIAESESVYEIVRVHGHKTLYVEDLVVMRERPETMDNTFVRMSDFSLHSLSDKDGNYVWCVKVMEDWRFPPKKQGEMPEPKLRNEF